MTVEELRALIMAGDAQRLLDALSDIDESDRPVLAKVAVSLTKQTLETGDHWKRNHAECCAQLAVFSLGSWEQVKRLRRDLTHVWSNGINLYDWIPVYLKARRPVWLERWASLQLAHEMNPQWRQVRQLVREGICPKPVDDNYIIRMIHGYWDEQIADEKWQLIDSLRADAELLQDEIWRIFEVEPPGKGVLLFPGDLVDQPMSWSKALKTLSMSGEVDRSRLLTESLEALRRGRRAAGATWFFKFHELLEPTLDERAERQSVYLDLLSNAVPAVVSFALDALSLLAREKRLDGHAYLDAVPRVFEVVPKGPPVLAIKLMGQLVKQQPDLAPSAAVVACRAVGHESSDLQLTAIKWLESLKPGLDEAVAAELDNHTASVAASLRERVKQLRESLQAHGAARVADVVATAVETANPPRNQSSKRAARTPIAASSSSRSSAVNLELRPEDIALQSKIAALTKAQQVALGIDIDLRAIDDGSELVARQINPLAMIYLLPEQELTPIVSLDELIEELSSAIEGHCDADKFERLLDGLSRLCDQRPPDFANRTAPLLNRADKLSDGFYELLRYEFGLCRLAFFLVKVWCQPDADDGIDTTVGLQRTGIEFLVDRVRELVRRISVGLAAPLLAAPTHRDGWLSPVAFVNRLLKWQQSGLEPYPLDMIQALLRLAPDDRHEAAIAARGVKSHLGHVVRFALGGPLDELAQGAAVNPALWIAAMRGRDPSLSTVKHANGLDGPDVWVPASRQWHAICRPDTLAAKADWPLKIQATIDPGFGSKEFRRELPTLKLNYERRLDDVWVDGEMRRLRQRYPKASLRSLEMQLHGSDMAWGPGVAEAMLQVWPINPDPTFMTGVVSILCVLDAPGSTLRRTAEFLEPLFASQTRFSEIAQLLVAVSLLAKDAGLKGYAADALIVLIEDGRCVGDELGGVLRRLLVSDAVKCNRLAAQLGEVARVSLLHAHVCARIVQTMFGDAASLPNGLLPNDAHHLLAPLLEWLVELDEPLREATRRVLATVTGASKTARIAKRLIARTSPVNPAQRHQVVLASRRARLRCARLYQPDQ